MRSPFFAILILAVAVLTLAFGAGTASASKAIVDYFGTDPAVNHGSLGGEFRVPGAVAVNQTGAGPADKGDIYVVDKGFFSPATLRNHRIQRFHRDDNGTPSNPYDDTFEFVSAWGADVVQSGGAGDLGDAAAANYEICTVASQCKAGVASGGNGTVAGNGALDFPASGSLAVDQDTGQVYVADSGNNRINVYEGDGTFLRSFGFDVVASGPGKALAAPDERQQLTVAADGGRFSLSFAGKATAARGTGRRTAVGDTVITFVKTTEGAFAVGQGVSGVGIAPGTTITAVSPSTLTISQPTTAATDAGAQLFADTFAHNISASELEDALNALSTIGGVGGSVSVSGGPGDPGGSSPYVIDFGGTLAKDDQPSIVATSGGLTSGGGSGTSTLSTLVQGGAYEICESADGDVCKAGTPGAGAGQVGQLAEGIAVSPPDGNAVAGRVFLADRGNRRVVTFGLDGSSPGSIGSAAVFDEGLDPLDPVSVAVDSRGILYAGSPVIGSDIERYDTQGVNGPVGFIAPIAAPPLSGNRTVGLTVDPDTDGAGPDSDLLYAVRSAGEASTINQFGPLNAPGLAVPPIATDETHGNLQVGAGEVRTIGIDETSGHIYYPDLAGAGQKAHGVYVLHEAGPAPTASLDSLSDITSTSVTAHATIDPNGPPPLSYRFEYSLNGTDWIALPDVLLGIQADPQAIDTVIKPGVGLRPNTLYHLRLSAAKKFATPVITPALTFTTDPAPPIAETTGAPHRTASTAQLNGWVGPRNSATSFHFEYVTEAAFDTTGFTDLSSGGSTTPMSAGADDVVHLVAAEIDGLDPNTTYRYRLVADNGSPGSPVEADDMAVRTRLAAEPLSHGDLPGPPGSDRAWEQVNMPNTGGNPVGKAYAFSEDGNRALYQIFGGTPLADTGSGASIYYAERQEGGWQSQWITPPREQLIGPSWLTPASTADLSALASINASGSAGGDDAKSFWRFGPGLAPTGLHEAPIESGTPWFAASDDVSRVVTMQNAGDPDPDYPGISGVDNLYDLSSGSAQLVSLLPGEAVANCGVAGIGGFATDTTARSLSSDGRLLYFPSRGNSCSSDTRLYVRDLQEEETKVISAPQLSGAACGAAFVKSTLGAVFFWTQTRLDPADTDPAGCISEVTGGGGTKTGGDVYRYETASEAVECVTCVLPGIDADVLVNFNDFGGAAAKSVAVSEDGSRLYFNSDSSLLPGVPAGQPHAYRLEVASRDLAYAGPIGSLDSAVLSPDGSELLFRSAAPTLNPLGEGLDNGGTAQYYRYDDSDRSLVCVSCPLEGSEPAGEVSASLSGGAEGGRNTGPLAENGTFAFAAPSALVGADQNSPGAGEDPAAGTDVYEWRDGRQLLVSDGITEWLPSSPPTVRGISPSGRDIYFTAPAQLTPDALDGYQRLYDARIGGGFEFPPPPPPCPLEVCQGTPKGAPSDPVPSSESFAGPGNVIEAPRPRVCPKGKRKVRRAGKTLCVKRKRAAKRSRGKNRTNHDRRAQR